MKVSQTLMQTFMARGQMPTTKAQFHHSPALSFSLLSCKVKQSAEIPAPATSQSCYEVPTRWKEPKRLQAGEDFSFLLISTQMHWKFLSGSSSSSKAKAFKGYRAPV